MIAMKVKINGEISIIYEGSVKVFSGIVDTDDKMLVKLLVLNGGIEIKPEKPKPEAEA